MTTTKSFAAGIVILFGCLMLCAAPKATPQTHTTPDTRSSTAVEHSRTPTPAASTRREARTVHYLTLKFTQSSFTLSISQHIKDAANSFTLTMPTTKEFYDSVKEGDELASKFKGASFLLSGNIGSRKVIVEKKYTRKE